MKNDNNDILQLAPSKGYKPPKLPTLEDARSNPELLRNLPSRWKKNAMAVACLGFVGMMAFSGCASLLDERLHYGGAPSMPEYIACPTEIDPWLHYGGSGGEPFYIACPTESDAFVYMRMQLVLADLALTAHHGGEGGAPTYVAHFTEHDVQEFIRAMLESMGLRFDAEGLNLDDPQSTAFIPLYDRDNKVAIMIRPPSIFSWLDEADSLNEDRLIAENPEITFGLINNPGEAVGHGECPASGSEATVITPELKEEARAILIENLVFQLSDFVLTLQSMGLVP